MFFVSLNHGSKEKIRMEEVHDEKLCDIYRMPLRTGSEIQDIRIWVILSKEIL